MEFTTTINPATGKKEGEYARIGLSEAQEKLKQACVAFDRWKHVAYNERSAPMRRLANLLERDKERYAVMITREMGKPIGQARKEIEKCAWVCRYYADRAEVILADQPILTEASKSYVAFSPLGAILAVMPWNFPFYQVIRFAAPAIMAGNVGLLKHASNVQGCATALECAFDEAGLPQGVFVNLNLDACHIKDLIEDPRIAAVTLTGSDAAGRAVAAVAGQNLKKTVMELGGSDAYIILEDVDLEKAAELATLGRLQNTGQTCIAAKRLIVVKEVYDDFLMQFCHHMKNAKMGDPLDEISFYGPMARTDLRAELHSQVKKTIAQGATLLLGGVIPEGPGAYYPATVLAHVRPGMEAFEQELFGPAAAVICAQDEEDALALANQSRFGLGAGVITKDKARGERIARRLEAGSSFVNKLVASDPRMPFGGVKHSGYGRELSDYGIREFVNIQSVWVE